MQSYASIVSVLVAGLCLALQAPTNAALARETGSVLFAALVSFAIGTAVLLVGWFAASRTAPPTCSTVHPWMLTGGALGAVYVAALAFAAPRIGLASALTLALASQLCAALLIDHFGLVGVTTTPFGPIRAAGAVLVVAGALLIRA